MLNVVSFVTTWDREVQLAMRLYCLADDVLLPSRHMSR